MTVTFPGSDPGRPESLTDRPERDTPSEETTARRHDLSSYEEMFRKDLEALQEIAARLSVRGHIWARYLSPRGPLETVTLTPRSYNDAREIAERFRAGSNVVLDLREMSASDAKRLLDFATGLAMGLDGRIGRVKDRVFLLTPIAEASSAEQVFAARVRTDRRAAMPPSPRSVMRRGQRPDIRPSMQEEARPAMQQDTDPAMQQDADPAMQDDDIWS
jgi:FtsZ-interacting cell division protein YlmF